MCVDIYCCLIRTTCRSGAFKSRSRNGKKSACVTQGIIIKIDARLCGLFQFRHEAHTHTPTTSTCRHTIDDRDHAKRKLSLDAIARNIEKKRKFFLSLSVFFFFLLFFSQLIRRRKKRESLISVVVVEARCD